MRKVSQQPSNTGSAAIRFSSLQMLAGANWQSQLTAQLGPIAVIEPGKLVLEDGTEFYGTLLRPQSGNTKSQENNSENVSDLSVGEVIFNTSMTGYQEILTDPSYRGQIMTFTCPHIGNVGVNSQDIESDAIQVEAMICHSLEFEPSNFRSESSLPLYVLSQGKSILTDIDTRALVLHLREKGALAGVVSQAQATASDTNIALKSFGTMEGKDYVRDVTCEKPYSWNELPYNMTLAKYPKVSENGLIGRPHVVAFDFGIKRNILRLLLQSGFRLTVVPSHTTAEQVQTLMPDAVFLSNGPGDPAALGEVISEIKKLLGKLPIFGICLGHQLLALAAGGKTYKLKFGHRGANHPVIESASGKVDITVQNHGFAVEKDSLPNFTKVTHLNLNDNTVAGIELCDQRAFGVQFHPEASAGPHDAIHLFGRFYSMVSE